MYISSQLRKTGRKVTTTHPRLLASGWSLGNLDLRKVPAACATRVARRAHGSRSRAAPAEPLLPPRRSPEFGCLSGSGGQRDQLRLETLGAPSLMSFPGKHHLTPRSPRLAARALRHMVRLRWEAALESCAWFPPREAPSPSLLPLLLLFCMLLL